MTEYHILESCNKCGDENAIEKTYSEEGLIIEAETKCKTCGFDDHWVAGFFGSSTEGFNACKKYTA